MIGRMTCNSNPVDMRKMPFVPEIGRKSAPIGESPIPVSVLPWQAKEGVTTGQPKFKLFNPVVGSLRMFGESRNCDCRNTMFTPVSRKAAKVTGPAIGTRYSMLEIRLVSPPGKTSW